MERFKLVGFSFMELTGAGIVGLLFLFAGYASVRYMSLLEQTIGPLGAWGMVAYVLVSILATVVAPISAAPLIPVAATVWGPFITGLLNITAWTTGSIIAFFIARRYGYEVVGRFVKLKKIQQYIETIPEKKLFSTVLFIRLTVPADVLSYALGLFSKMRFVPYTVATLIGVSPFAFILAYTVTFSFFYQILIVIIIGLILFFSYRSYYRLTGQKVNQTTGE